MSWKDCGDKVWVTTRSLERAQEFQAQGLSPIILDVTQPIEEALPEIETVVFAVGFDRSSGHNIENVYVHGLHRLLGMLPASVQKLIYVSSTGVYGSTQGEWVDEETACQPTRDGGKACLAAEQLLQNHDVWRDRTIILRLAGIYGPDRLPLVAKLQAGEPLPVDPLGFLNLIHVDDIVQVIRSVDDLIAPPELFCVSDGNPVKRSDFYAHAATLLEIQPPIFSTPDPHATRTARSRGSKKISNRRLNNAVPLEWLHPDYKSGLAAMLG